MLVLHESCFLSISYVLCMFHVRCGIVSIRCGMVGVSTRRAEQGRAEQGRAEQSSTQQSTAQHSTAEQSTADDFILFVWIWGSFTRGTPYDFI
jgi:hypothetical protein